MASPIASPGDEAARVCLDILRGASQLAQPYAAHLSKLLQGEGREQERALVEALGGCLLEVVAAARGTGMEGGASMEVRAREVKLLAVLGCAVMSSRVARVSDDLYVKVVCLS
jgi:hypothetical protein